MKKAFTLVEMLVVIGIIAVLAATLIVTMGNGTESANAAKCLANMHSLAVAVQTTTMAGGGDIHRYPFAGSFTRLTSMSSSGGTEQARGWIGWKTKEPGSSYVSPYSNDEDARHYCLTNGTLWTAMDGTASAYVCPTHKKVAMEKMGPSLPVGPAWSYAMSAKFLWQSRERPPFSHRRLGVGFEGFRRSDRTVLFAELPFLEIPGIQDPQFNASAEDTNDPILQYLDCEGCKTPESIGFNHRSGKRDYCAHVCFVDGHTEKIVLPRQSDTENIRQATRWLCHPYDDQGKDLDVVTENGRFGKMQN